MGLPHPVVGVGHVLMSLLFHTSKISFDERDIFLETSNTFTCVSFDTTPLTYETKEKKTNLFSKETCLWKRHLIWR